MSALDGLPPLRDVIARHGLDALKALGQNFLLDLNLTQKIAPVVGRPLEGVTVFEVGPVRAGSRARSWRWGRKRWWRWSANRRAIPALQEIAAHYPAGSTSSRATRGNRYFGDHRRTSPAGEPCRIIAQPALQLRHAIAGQLGHRALAALLAIPAP